MASSNEANGRDGYSGQYLRVRKIASAKALSSLTRGRLNEATTPNH
jgi:hypothetical protein